VVLPVPVPVPVVPVPVVPVVPVPVVARVLVRLAGGQGWLCAVVWRGGRSRGRWGGRRGR
jgi:hypothetical protein